MLKLLKMPFLLRSALKRLDYNQSELKRFQEDKIKGLIKYCYDNNSFYRDKMKKAGVIPDDVKTVSDLNKLPIVKKDEFRSQSISSLMSRGYSLEKLRMLKTSGSTGKPLQLYLTSSEDLWRKAVYLRANIFCGQKIRDKWVFVTSPGHFSDTTGIQKFFNVYAQRCISIFDDIDVQINRIGGIDPDVLDGYSSSIVLLAKRCDDIDDHNINPRLMFGNAEVIDEGSVKYVEDVFDAPYYDQYGSVEFNRTAWQCPSKLGYHLDVDSVITQFLDDEGNEVSYGERGRIVLTSLFNYAMPFIRYDIGDVGVPLDGLCDCGLPLPLMKSVEGRRDSFIMLPGNRLISPRNLTVTMSYFEYYYFMEQFRITQKRIDEFEILIKLKKTDINADLFINKLINHLNNFLNLHNNEVNYRVYFVEEIKPGPGGKLVAVKSEVEGDFE